MVIVAMPVLGSILYFTLGNKHTGAKLKRKLGRSDETMPELAKMKGASDENVSIIKKDDERIAQTLAFINDSTGFPVIKNGTSKYYPFGEDMFADMWEKARTVRTGRITVLDDVKHDRVQLNEIYARMTEGK